MTSAPGDLLRRVLATGLPGAPRASWPTEPLDPVVWSTLLATTRRHRMEGLLTAAMADGLPVLPEQAEAARAAHCRAAVLAVELEALLVDLAGAFGELGLTMVVIKGPAHAHLLYADPARRSFGDLDLLLPGDQLGPARRVLEARGGRRRYPEPRPGFDARFSKGLAMRLPDGAEIDLHRTLAPGPYGLVLPVGDLFGRTQPLHLGAVRLDALGHEDQFLHAALHGVLGSAEPNLVALRDLAQILADDRSGAHPLDTPAVLERARQWRAEAPLSLAIRQMGIRLRLPATHPLQRWAIGQVPSWRDRQWLTAYEGSTRSSARQSILALSAIARWQDRAAYATAMAFPTRDPDRAPAATRWRRARQAVFARRPR